MILCGAIELFWWFLNKITTNDEKALLIIVKKVYKNAFRETLLIIFEGAWNFFELSFQL